MHARRLHVVDGVLLVYIMYKAARGHRCGRSPYARSRGAGRCVAVLGDELVGLREKPDLVLLEAVRRLVGRATIPAIEILGDELAPTGQRDDTRAR